VILVDTSVWVDYFRGNATPQCERLYSLLGAEPLAIGDLILTEVLQGFDSEEEFEQARAILTPFTLIELGGRATAVRAAQNFRKLRALGITIRKTIDTIIATRCIDNDFVLLHADRDFDPFVEHLGLRSVL
jgi:predicted nucleic acid-binding protein